MKKQELRQDCVTADLPFPQVCPPMGLRKQMEFNSKKNRELREKVKEIITYAQAIEKNGEDGDDSLFSIGKMRHDAKAIQILALDILVEL